MSASGHPCLSKSTLGRVEEDTVLSGGSAGKPGPACDAPCGEGASPVLAIPRVEMNRACRSPARAAAVEHKGTDSPLIPTNDQDGTA